MTAAQEILHTHWGHTSFRELQEDIINEVSEGRDVIALLPTGGGKSLCFQIPALLKPGICIVISPLIALMEDQVNALKGKGVKAMALTGGIPFRELDIMLDNCIYGNYKFLYLSPERLQQELVKERIKQMEVNLIAVDEAHCISSWGHDFRPSYRNINILRELKPEVNFIALTATATSAVVTDIAAQLQLNNPEIFKKSFARKNIAYLVKPVQDKNYYLSGILKRHKEPAIIYVRSRKATVEIALFLEKNNISAISYHGGISREEKTKRLNQWLNNEKRVMVATSAFGMGIDKADVRTIVHIHLPESLESYFQEAGRAGRDGKASEAIILTNESDMPRLQNQFLRALPDVAFVKLLYRKLLTYFRIAYGEGEGSIHNFNFADFCHTYQLDTQKAYNSIQLLDRAGVLQLSENFQKKTQVEFLCSHHQTNYFLENNSRYDRLIKAILRTYGGAFDQPVEINLRNISSKSGKPVQEVLKLLNEIKKAGIIDFEHDIHDASITFLVPREDDSTINPLAPYIELQANSKKEKIKAILDYVRNDEECKSVQILKYFGETEIQSCGKCSVCIKSTAKLTNKKIKIIYTAITGLLSKKEYSAREIVQELPFEEQQVISVLQILVEKNILQPTAANKYKIKL